MQWGKRIKKGRTGCFPLFFILNSELKEKPQADPEVSRIADGSSLPVVDTVYIGADPGLDPGIENVECVEDKSDSSPVIKGKSFFQPEIKTGVCWESV